jgi:uncharacterized protein YjbI with pentapeptide repeats
MEPWVFFQIGVVLAVAASGRFRWMTAVFLVLLAYGTMPLWIVFFQIISAGTGLVLYRELISDWGKSARWRCRGCLKSEWYPSLAEITKCSCGRTEGRRENLWYFRCSCGCLYLLEGGNLPPENRTVHCGKCERITNIQPVRKRWLSIENPYKVAVSDPSLNWRLEAAHSNGTMWLFNPRLRKVHLEIRRFNRRQERSTSLNLLAWGKNKRYVLALFGGLALVMAMGLKMSGVLNPDSTRIVMGLKIEDNVNLIDADLRGADLRGAELSGAELSGADLRGADLRGADLAGAYLFETDLSGADLTNADLSGALLYFTNLSDVLIGTGNLTNANLVGANLTNADLSGANLTKANLDGANLTNADLSGANLTKARLTNINLTHANLAGSKKSMTDFSGSTMPDGSIKK